MRYAIWNNKGGVGKTFVTFVTACEYARQNPSTPVVVVDMCPQANISEILLGGNGKGAVNLQGLLDKTPRQTVGGYFDDRIVSPHSLTGTESSFAIHASKFNENLQDNVYLVAGDPSLEIQSQAMSQISAQTLPANSWKNVHMWLLDLIKGVRVKLPNAVFFIDCNPSFANYTELALVASERLIVPCTADGSSARAISNIGQLIYGIGVPESYAQVNFAKRAEDAGVGLPSIHVVPLNRSTQYDKSASKAFGAMYGEIKRRIAKLHSNEPHRFSVPLDDLFMDIPDAHSVSVVASHEGLPLDQIKLGPYTIYDNTTQVRKDSLERYQGEVAALVAKL